jgi:hypothetical protein
MLLDVHRLGEILPTVPVLLEEQPTGERKGGKLQAFKGKGVDIDPFPIQSAINHLELFALLDETSDDFKAL